MKPNDLSVYLQDDTRFREWLEQKEPDKVIGTIRNCNVCPIAEFLADKLRPKYKKVAVSVAHTYIAAAEYRSAFYDTRSSVAKIVPPMWVQHFLLKIDKPHLESWQLKSFGVTAKEALDALRSITT